MTDVGELFERVAEQAGRQARPPSLTALRRRRDRRSAARAGTGAVLLAAAGAALVPWAAPGGGPDVVVADAATSAPPAAPAPVREQPAVRVPEGMVVVPAAHRPVLRLGPDEPPVADLLSTYATEQGPLVTAGLRRGDELCHVVFTDGGADAPGAGAECTSVSLPAYRSGRLDVGAASAGPSGGGAVDWLVLRGSAPAGTRTVVVTASGGDTERVPVVPAGAQYLDRAWFALPWVEQDTVVTALDADGRTLAESELLLAMGQPRGG